jgi:hypothetical protein
MNCIKNNLKTRIKNIINAKMEYRCHKCNEPIFENYYCDECYAELQKPKKEKENKAKEIRDFIFRL